jgi:hypothetical protein
MFVMQVESRGEIMLGRWAFGLGVLEYLKNILERRSAFGKQHAQFAQAACGLQGTKKTHPAHGVKHAEVFERGGGFMEGSHRGPDVFCRNARKSASGSRAA